MFHVLKKSYNTLLFRSVPIPLRRDILPAQLTSTPVRNLTTYVLNNTENTKRSRWRRRIILGLLSGSLGYFFGKSYIYEQCFPTEPDSVQDVKYVKLIGKLLDNLPATWEARSDPRFVEWEAYDGFSNGDKERRLTSGPLRGSRGLAVQKIFWNEEQKRCVNVVHFGKSLEGWPRIVHGGILATVLDETLGRVAIRSVPAHTGVTAHLDIKYINAVKSDRPYLVVAYLDKERSTDRKAYVTGGIFDPITKKVYCRCEALFVVPKGLSLRRIEERF
ncbi:thioesterase family protein [Talaromyces stipitatus ATCC 10500]|uniref:Thioesterase family protein n=1 Tax=Talaromyces stipitatus (strain ATCC 10500 / CBS 375.48 / QM 6759 / NRRL 1006) TaxID=441959 RepID=B8M6G3_TALSN|nr:thioesterase family protein [Talaromyces stipitatus ATCC 10500]EED19338.1 thioesterase family protein [Talaromyces stipitatus ATCC 10500]